MTARPAGRAESGSLVLDRRSSAVRAVVGALAWSILEEAALAAAREDDQTLVAAVDARGLARSLGIGKDTAARGLAGLIDAGILRRTITREPTGRFGRSRYVLSLPDGLQVLAPTVSGEPVSRGAGRGVARTRGARPAGRSSQLSLLAAGSGVDG